jgi:hypothetical protein
MNQNQTESKPQDVEEPREEGLDETACSDVWEYSQYRASLRRNGVTFALVTRDGKNSLNPKEQTILLAALNRPNAKGER